MSDDRKILAWHIPMKGLKLAYGDNRRVAVGKTLSVTCRPVICERGLHGSIELYDALSYADSDSSYITRVEIWGDIDSADDKLCGAHRRCVARLCKRDALWVAAKHFAQALAGIDLPTMSNDTHTIAPERKELIERIGRVNAKSEINRDTWRLVRNISCGAYNRHTVMDAAITNIAEMITGNAPLITIRYIIQDMVNSAVTCGRFSTYAQSKAVGELLLKEMGL